jgi:UDP-N-acetylmuramyl tripeptide synthase
VAAVLIDAGLTPKGVAERFASCTRRPVAWKRSAVTEPLVVVDYAHTPDALESAWGLASGGQCARCRSDSSFSAVVAIAIAASGR